MKTATATTRYDVMYEFMGMFSKNERGKKIYVMEFFGYATERGLKTAMERTAERLNLRLKWVE